MNEGNHLDVNDDDEVMWQWAATPDMFSENEVYDDIVQREAERRSKSCSGGDRINLDVIEKEMVRSFSAKRGATRMFLLGYTADRNHVLRDAVL